MKTKLLSCLVAVLVITLSGCASIGPAVPVAKIPESQAKAAVYPAKPDYQAASKAYFATILKDPLSAQYSNWMLSRAYIPIKGAPIFGHVVNVNVNAKNSYGGYVGNNLYFLWIGPDGVARDALSRQVEIVDIVE